MKLRQRIGLLFVISGCFQIIINLLGSTWMIEIKSPNILWLIISGVFFSIGALMFTFD